MIRVYLDEKESIIEAMLFASGNAVRGIDIADVLNVEEEDVREFIKSINTRFDEENRPIIIREIDNSFQMCTKPKYHEYIRKIQEKKPKKSLSQSAMETLAIVAYKQPITRVEVEKIRGVNSDYALNTLTEFGLIEDIGRADLPGRPLLYSTTQEFLRKFGYSSLNDLPKFDMEDTAQYSELISEEE